MSEMSRVDAARMKYRETFGEGFPNMCMCFTEEEEIAKIEECIRTGVMFDPMEGLPEDADI